MSFRVSSRHQEVVYFVNFSSTRSSKDKALLGDKIHLRGSNSENSLNTLNGGYFFLLFSKHILKRKNNLLSVQPARAEGLTACCFLWVSPTILIIILKTFSQWGTLFMFLFKTFEGFCRLCRSKRLRSRNMKVWTGPKCWTYHVWTGVLIYFMVFTGFSTKYSTDSWYHIKPWAD